MEKNIPITPGMRRDEGRGYTTQNNKSKTASYPEVTVKKTVSVTPRSTAGSNVYVHPDFGSVGKATHGLIGK